jgi:hypothetical protein
MIRRLNDYPLGIVCNSNNSLVIKFSTETVLALNTSDGIKVFNVCHGRDSDGVYQVRYALSQYDNDKITRAITRKLNEIKALSVFDWSEDAIDIALGNGRNFFYGGMKLPIELEYWTCDEVAECLDGVGMELYDKLWTILLQAKNPTPIGGDGSNGTVEDPSGRLDLDNDDKAGNWWDKLSTEEQAEIVTAYQNEYGGE